MRRVASRLAAARLAAHRPRFAAFAIAAIDTREAANAEAIAGLVIRGQAGDSIAFAFDALSAFRIVTSEAAIAARRATDELRWTATILHAFLVRAATHAAPIDLAAGIERRAAGIAAHATRFAAAESVTTFPIATDRLLASPTQHARIATDAVLAHLMPLAARFSADRPVPLVATEPDAAIRADLPRRAAPVVPMLVIPNNRTECAGVLRAAE